jgi:CheY-like chemotaxis protein
MRFTDDDTGTGLTDYELRVDYGNVSLPDPVTQEPLDIATVSNNTRFRILGITPSILQAETTQGEAGLMKVFIVEDSVAMLNNLQSMLSDVPGIAVIGMAVDESHAIERINALRPDVVTLDIHLQSGSGLGVLKNIKEHYAGIKVMMLTNCPEYIYIDYCMSLGADYFFDKSLQYMQFCDALRSLAQLERAGNGSGTLQVAKKLPAACCSTSSMIGNS